MEKSIEELQEEVIEEFSLFEEWMDKYELLIEKGKNLAPFPEEHRVDENLIEGCQSRVWLYAELREGKVYFQADSDAIIVRGIVALLLSILSGQSPKAIAEADLYFIERTGLKENLSPTRSNGLYAMLKQMKLFALALEKE
ncbi:MAG TPA: Fe-S metabolism protein SufE [Porphyromonadaceae bacterium]|nr:Fe-S metabolism protein SufE [Porphyromonadaceae bacterium]